MRIHTSTQKIVATILSFAMVLTLVVGLTASPVGAQSASYSFTRNLTVGSRGDDVAQLQTVLETNGYLVMPSGVAKGYFGSLTRSALAKWQAAVGISPAAGFFGPITRAYLASQTTTGGTTTVAGCPAGAKFNYMTGAPCPTTTPTTPSTGGTLDNTDGSLTVSLSSFAGNTTIKKGETKDVIAVKAQATAGKVAISRFDVRLNNRPWLYFSKLTLRDTDGTVIATKNLTGASDATEITVGTDYLVRFDGLNYVVTPGMDKTLVVSATVLATTDKLSSDVNVTVSVPTGSIRVVNGKGFTDSLGLGSGNERTVTLTGSGSTANVVVRTSPSTLAARIQTTSTSGQTNDVEVGKFDFKAENQDATINRLSFKINLSSSSYSSSTIFKNLRLTDGSSVYNVDSVSGSTGSSTFSNLNIALTKDAWKTLTLKADIADQDEFTQGTMASTSIVANVANIVGVDSNYTTVTATGGNTAASNNVTFLSSAVQVVGPTASQTLVDNGSSASNKSLVRFTFALNNVGNDDVYVSKTVSSAVTATTTGNASTTSSTVTTSPSSDSGDTASVWRIPAGTSRTFVYEFVVSNTGNAASNIATAIGAIYFGTSAGAPTANVINFGLDALRVSGQVF